MSDLVSKLMKERIKFVIPNAGKLKYTNIDKNDKALVYTIDRGYLETISMESCYYFSLFLRKTEYGKFIEVGDIEKVNLKLNSIVYRQRFYFNDLSLLIKIIGHFNGKIIIPNSFNIGIQQMTYCLDSVLNLEKYFLDKGIRGYTMDEWLTNCCLLQIYILSSMDNVYVSMYKSIEEMAQSGVLARAPYLSGINDNDKTSVIVPPISEYLMRKDNSVIIDLLDSDNYTYYLLDSDKSKNIAIYGYTTRNVRADKELL